MEKQTNAALGIVKETPESVINTLQILTNQLTSFAKRKPTESANATDLPVVKRIKLDKISPNTAGQPKSYLENLIPDCLYHIYKYLKPLDIANASEASVHLSNFAENNIYKDYEDCQIFAIRECQIKNTRYRYKLKDFVRILRHFGKHFKRLTIKGNHYQCPSTNQAALTIRKCTNLDELRIINIRLNEKWEKALQKVPCSARHLTLKCLGITSNWNKVLKRWWKVTALTVYDVDQDILIEILYTIRAINCLTLVKGYITKSFFKRLQQTQGAYLLQLSMIDMYHLIDGYIEYKIPLVKYRRFPPKLLQLQISVDGSTRIQGLEQTNLKYLQIVQRQWSSLLQTVKWSLSDLKLLDELDLVDVAGSLCRIAADVPTLRVFSIQGTRFLKDDGLAETVFKLPKLQLLRLKCCEFPSDDLVNLVVSHPSLRNIDLERPEMRNVKELLEALSKISNNNLTLSKTSSFSVEVRIIVSKRDFNRIDDASCRLPNVRWILEKDFKQNHHRFKRFERWDQTYKDSGSITDFEEEDSEPYEEEDSDSSDEYEENEEYENDSNASDDDTVDIADSETSEESYDG